MKTFLLLSALLASTLAIPGGYYYQESSSKSSSSSYKNNELQHQTEDESYYSRRGDTEGRTAPKVNTYAQHLEYQNPTRQDYGHAISLGLQGQNTYGHADDDRYAARQAVGSDGIVRTVSGNRNQYSYTATYGVSGGETAQLHGGEYDTQSNLLSLTQRLQNDLSKQLNNAITKQKTYDSYGSNIYVESEFRNLEQELKANLTRQLQEELQRQYGTQASRGSHSYTIKNGRYSQQANYNTQELKDLTSQVESNLLQQLRNQYQSTQSSSSSNNYYASQHAEQGSRGHTTMYRPTHDSFPLHPEVRPSVSLTDVLSQVQNTVDRKLNDALSRVEERYLTQNVAYSDVPNYDVILENLLEELRRNITATLQTTLMEHYGTQEEHNNYYYSSRNVASGSRVANYKIDDLESLKQQIENNLKQKLRNSIQQQKQTYQTTKHTYSQSQSYNTNYNTGYSQTKPSSPEIYTSYVVFTPSRRPDTTYSQSNTHSTDNSYTSHNQQTHTRPEYRPIYSQTDSQRPIRYGTYQPSSQSTSHGVNSYQSSRQDQQSQRTEQLEYDYSPTAGQSPSGSGPSPISQTPYRGTSYPSSTGTNYPSGSATYPSSSGVSYPSGSVRYPSTSGTNYPSGGDSNYQTNYQTSQQSRESSYKIAAAQRETGIEYSPGSGGIPRPEYQAELINIRDQVQNDISRQLNSAIERQGQSSTSYSSSSVSNSQILADLSEELKQNLTKKIEQALNEHYGRTGVRGGYSYTVTSGGRINPGNYNREQLTTLTNQLQEDLLRQLREGLAQQSYRQSSSHSSRTYEPVMSQGTYGLGSNSYRSYSSGSSYSYGSSNGQGECCMQADDATTTTRLINQDPIRGDIGIDSKHTKQSKDINSEDQLTQDNSEDIEDIPSQDNKPVDIEVVPPENVETSTPKLARDKPSTRPTTVKPMRQEQPPQQTPLTSQTDKITQQLIDFERYNQNDNQQQIQQAQSIDQQLTDDYIDQQNLEQTYFDQDTVNGFDQFIDEDQQNEDLQAFDQQSQRQSGGIVQQTINQFGQDTDQEQHFEDQRRNAGRIVQSAVQNKSSSESARRGSAQQSYYNTQQTEDMSLHSQYVNQYQRRGQRIEQSEVLPQLTEDMTQQVEDLTQQTEDLTQQTEDLTQQIEDLTQQTEDLAQQPEDLTQQTEDLAQQSQVLTQQQNEDLTQQTEDLTQQIQDLTQQTENLDQQHYDQQAAWLDEQRNSPHRASQNSYLSQQEQQHMSQHNEDTNDSGESFYLHSGGSSGHHSASAYRSHSSQSSSLSHSSSEIRQIHYGTINQVPLQTVSDLEQQHVEQQHANVVQDVSHQAINFNTDSVSSTVAEQKLQDVEIVTTTEKAGFWKRLGGKISNTYHKAKDSIVSIG